MDRVEVATWSELDPLTPAYAFVGGVDLVVIRWSEQEQASVLYGRCLHRGALLADGEIVGDNLVCGVHNWDYRYRTGVSEYHNDQALHRFTSWVDDDTVWVDAEEIRSWASTHPQAFDRDAYQGLYQDTSPVPEEPHVALIRELASHGLDRIGHHGPVGAMGVPRDRLPSWDDIQIVTAQLARPPLLDDEPVGTDFVIGPAAKKPLRLEIPLFVSDMSFGALSAEAKVALARGAELAQTAICSGEGGMLDEEQAENGRYLYELASGRFGFTWEKLERVQAFHFKGGQGAKTGTGGHLPGHKVSPKIAAVRGLEVGQPAISPSRFPEWSTSAQVAEFAEEVRARTDGIPVAQTEGLTVLSDSLKQFSQEMENSPANKLLKDI